MNGYTVAGPRSGGTAQAAAPWRRATRGESRWPAVIAAVAASALQMALPGWLSLGPQMQQPELAPPGWKPSFTDYLYLSFTSAISFAASDVTPLTRWAKTMMMLQSAVSVAAIALVVARAVNILR